MEITVLKAICREIGGILQGTRLTELEEGPSGEVYLAFKGKGQRHVLLISPRPGLPRVYLTGRKPPRSKGLSPFAQSIRNHIIGSDLVSIVQTGLERAVFFYFSRKKEGMEEKTCLVFEIAGKKPELILLDDMGKILLAQSYVPLSDEAVRPILPGLAYQTPPLPAKLDPYSVTEEEIRKIMRETPDIPLGKALFAHIGGISPLLASEAAYAIGEKPTPGKILETIKALLQKVANGPYEPGIYGTNKGPVLSGIELKQFSGMPVEPFASMCEAANGFYETLMERQRMAALKTSLVKDARAKLHAADRKLAAIVSDHKDADRAGEYQLYGKLLMASLGSVPAGALSVDLVDLFSENGERVSIPLDPRLNPVKNAELYFKKAKKAKAGSAILRDRLLKAEEETNNLKALLEKIESASIIDELLELKGTTSPKRKGVRKSGKAGAEAVPDFPRFTSSDGYEVLYGKNARQNDVVTFKVAGPMDLWLHAQGFHGSHVIVRNPERRPDIPLQTILEAAGVAAYFSGAKKDLSVAVDYTFRKYVRKPKDPTPGQAIFTNNKTVFVGPKKREDSK
jgi:predicted ribosome quality control (RQC) complex YloA/Tae2 family protein